MNKMNKNQKKRSVARKRDLQANGKVNVTGIGSAEGGFKYTRAPLAQAKRSVTYKPRVNGGREFRVKHTEYLGDLTAVAPAWDVTTYSINPGLASSFPWLNSLARNFEQYRIRRLRVRFESSAPATEFGRVFMAFDYDPMDDPPIDKGSLMSFFGASSDAVWAGSWAEFIGPRVGKTFYVRSGGVVGDIRLYDAANLFVSTAGVANGVNCGEIYVDYEIDLINPQGSTACSLDSYMAAEISSGGSAFGHSPLTGASSSNPAGVSVDSSSTFSIHTPGNYAIAITCLVTSGVPAVGTSFSLTKTSGTGAVQPLGFGYNTSTPSLVQTWIIDQSSIDGTYTISNFAGGAVTIILTSLSISPAAK